MMGSRPIARRSSTRSHRRGEPGARCVGSPREPQTLPVAHRPWRCWFRIDTKPYNNVKRTDDVPDCCYSEDNSTVQARFSRLPPAVLGNYKTPEYPPATGKSECYPEKPPTDLHSYDVVYECTSEDEGDVDEGEHTHSSNVVDYNVVERSRVEESWTARTHQYRRAGNAHTQLQSDEAPDRNRENGGHYERNPEWSSKNTHSGNHFVSLFIEQGVTGI